MEEGDDPSPKEKVPGGLKLGRRGKEEHFLQALRRYLDDSRHKSGRIFKKL